MDQLEAAPPPTRERRGRGLGPANAVPAAPAAGPTATTLANRSTMIQHVAVFKWKPDASAEDLSEWMRRLRALPDQVDELVSLTVGADMLHGDRSWDAAVVATLDSREGLTKYVEHPEHQAILLISAPHVAQLIQVDFEL
jgi:hypothetical protein